LIQTKLYIYKVFIGLRFLTPSYLIYFKENYFLSNFLLAKFQLQFFVTFTIKYRE